MKTVITTLIFLLASISVQAKTLIVYYSYTNNVEHIVNELSKKIDADVLEIQPAEKGLDYAANNYAIGSAQISAIRNNPNSAASYPAIDAVNVNLEEYNCIIVGAPLWWSNMASPLQSFLFQYGKEMTGKKIGLIVSSASSGISGVESDARHLIPGGDFLSPSLWIRSSQTANASNMLDTWLEQINYTDISAGVTDIAADKKEIFTVFTLSGVRLNYDAGNVNDLPSGLYIINGSKTLIR